MAHIKINFDGLTENASKLSTHTQSYEALNARMMELTQQIQAGWEGKASSAYVEMMQKYHQQAIKVVGILDKFKNYTTNVKECFSELDSQCANRIRNSF